MLTFEDNFHSDGALRCFIWANETVMGRVQFNIGSEILEEELHGGNAVHDDANLALCEKERPRVEAACRHAFASRPSKCIDLQPSDFHAS